MTTELRGWVAGLVAGIVLIVAPCSEAQIIAPVPVGHPDLYAKVKVAGFTVPIEVRQTDIKTRVDLTIGGILQSYIADREKGVLISLTATGQNRTALVFPLDRGEGLIPLPLDLAVLVRQATLKVVGASLVGGRPCRLIAFSNYLNQSGLICASAENVILQMTRKGQRNPLFEVIDYSMSKQDPKWFRTPPDYQIAVVPAIGGASASGSEGDAAQMPLTVKPHSDH